MEIRNEFGGVPELIGIDARGFLVSAFIACPSDEILKLAATSVVNLGIEDFGDFEFGLVFNNKRWG